MKTDEDLGYKKAFKAIRVIGNLLSSSTGDVSQSLQFLEVGYVTILDFGSKWGVSFLQGVEDTGNSWWEKPENYKYTAIDESFYKAVAKAYNLVLDEIQNSVDTQTSILETLDR